MRISISVRLVVLGFLYFSLAGCQSNRISVTGIAYNDKNKAGLINKQGQYFLDGLHHWDEKYLDRRVKVTGTLLVIKYVKDTLHPPGYKQERAADENIILKPKWKLVSKEIIK